MFTPTTNSQAIEMERFWHHYPIHDILSQLETDATHGLSISAVMEPKEPGLMQRAPRPPRSPLLRKVTIRRIFVAGVLLATLTFITFNIALGKGQPLPTAQTVAVNTLVGGEIAMLLGFRSLTYSLPEIGPFSNL